MEEVKSDIEQIKSSKIENTETKNAKVVREEGLDKFYTIPSYSKKCINKVFSKDMIKKCLLTDNVKKYILKKYKLNKNEYYV